MPITAFGVSYLIAILNNNLRYGLSPRLSPWLTPFVNLIAPLSNIIVYTQNMNKKAEGLNPLLFNIALLFDITMRSISH